MLDADDLPNGHRVAADVCIVGAGAAGIALALRLIDSGLDVVVLEAGGEGREPATQSLYEGTVSDERMHTPPDRYRQRRFGGSTTIWGGRCMPFDPIDFEARAFMPHSGWPIGPEALAPYYPEANRLCEAGACAYRLDEAFDRPMRPMINGFASPRFSTDTIERFSCPTNFAARYGHKLRAASNVRVLTHANVTALGLDPSGRRVVAATVKTLAGRQHEVAARWFVLAVGGLEVARLLLASRDVAPRGIGNAHDVVGRYYMCHVAGVAGTLTFDGPLDAVWNGYDVADDGTYCRRRIALDADAQRSHGIGNFIARLHHPKVTDPAHRTGILSLLNLGRIFIPYEYGRRLHGEERIGFANWLRHLRNVVLDLPGTAAFLWHWLRYRTLAERKYPSVIVRPRTNRYSLDFHAEQQPNPDSRVTLGSERDALGMPKLHIDWRYTATDVDTVKRGLALLAEDLEKSGVGRFSYDPDEIEAEMTRYGAYGGHHIGTTRMGTDPTTSVVDADCRVHGVDNLFVASAAIFPTSSQANPTLTIVAFALRLADHLKRRAGPDAGTILEAADDDLPVQLPIADRSSSRVAAL